MTKEIWRKRWLFAINGLISFEFQENGIAKMTSNDAHSSFNYFVNLYFVDTLFGFNYDFYVGHSHWLTQEEYEAVKDWHNELESNLFPNHKYLYKTDILRDNLWLSILQKGILAKQKLKLIIPESEKKYLR